MDALFPKGPPYVPRNAQLGGLVNTKVDVPVSAVFIAIFAMLAATHMTIFQRNKRRGILFIPSGATFGFCMSRIVTFSMRIAWAKDLLNVSLAIAANVFVSAGVIILFIVNLYYARRIHRGYHPRFANTLAVTRVFRAYYFSIIPVLIMVITATVVSFYTMAPKRLKSCRDIQRFGMMYFLVFCFMPIPVVLLSRFVPSTTKQKFGTPDRLIHKVFIVLTAGVLLTLSTGFRVGAAYSPPRPMFDPTWFHGKPAFYCFIPMLEVLVVLMYAVTRVDRRFYIPKVNKEGDLEKKHHNGADAGSNEELEETEA
ncbi:hypothetical protein EX30DRAFT_361985 [Ascodesmis nigricans]|uniref:Family A G protein-coupled receptor-like protein n=1 Tax=Ascodesmis nigricans TaxID=341454 RepID=A0A4S2N4S0_9PEZI|nr:hypothetical protein EX30DRAFT_361985 [Ascodesmis nigricans]